MTNVSELIEQYSCGAQLLRDAIQETSDSGWDAIPIPGKWSIRQVVCHLADAEIIYADRMKRVIAEDNPTVFEADPNIHLPALHCSQRSWESELKVIESVRAHILPILNSLSSDDFRRTCIHSLDGSMTLATLLERITGHIPYHLTFIEEKLNALNE